VFALARRRRTLDIWPGFVDVLSSLLLVVTFVILVFTLGHFSLGKALIGRERMLERLNAEIAELAEILSLEKKQTAELRQSLGDLEASLGRVTQERDTATSALARTRTELDATGRELTTTRDSATALRADIAVLREVREELEREVAGLARALDESRQAETAQTALAAHAQAQVELLNRQLAALRQQLTEISTALELSRRQVGEQQAQIEDLGERLNVALAEKVQELARYRSEFFGRLREALGNHPDVRIVGDRFVLQSELLFDTASAELGPAGQQQIAQLVRTLQAIAADIPPDVEWILRIDGHTDRRPIRTERYPSNWELSTARALAIVGHMIELGIPPARLAATGFAEFHPLATGDDERAYASNRRIELQLTNR
jgi:chemotaxis protein MotB